MALIIKSGNSGSLLNLTASGSIPIEAPNGITFTGTINVGNFPSVQPVSGSIAINNFPATQPVSGSISVNNFPATQPVSGAISITNFPATQPISGAVIANAGTGTFATDDVSSSTIGASTPASAMYMGGNKSGVLAGLLLDTNGNLSVNVSDVGGNASTAKGVQPAAALPAQDLKDSGRTYVILYIDRIAGVTSEALVTMNINRGGSVTTGTSYTVSAGKIFRIQSINAEILNSTTTINRVLIRLRSAGAVSVSSPIIAMAMASSQAAAATAGDTDPHSFPDGLEVAAGQQIGMSQVCNATTAGVVSAIVVGYEY